MYYVEINLLDSINIMKNIKKQIILGILSSCTLFSQTTDSFAGQFTDATGSVWTNGTTYSSQNGSVTMTLNYEDNGYILNTAQDPTPVIPTGGPGSLSSSTEIWFGPGVYQSPFSTVNNGSGTNDSWFEMCFSAPVDGLTINLRDLGEYDMNVAVIGGTVDYAVGWGGSSTYPSTVTGNGTSSLSLDGSITAAGTNHLNGDYTFNGSVTKVRWTFTADANNYGTFGGVTSPADSGAWSTPSTFTVVPEPSSSALLGLGALGLLVRRKR